MSKVSEMTNEELVRQLEASAWVSGSNDEYENPAGPELRDELLRRLNAAISEGAEKSEPAAREWVAALEKKYGNCCGDVIHLFAEDLEREVTRYSDELRAERNRARETNRELNRRNQELTRSLNLETGRKAWYGYFQAALHLLRDEGTKREAAERSLLQAQDLWEEIAVELDSAGIPASEPAPEGGLNFIATSNRVKMLIEKLASTSAPEGTV